GCVDCPPPAAGRWAADLVLAREPALAGGPALDARQQLVGPGRGRGPPCAPLSSSSARSEAKSPVVRRPPFSSRTANDSSRARGAGREDLGRALRRRPRQWPAGRIRDTRS